MFRFNYRHQGDYYLCPAKVTVVKIHSQQCNKHQQGPTNICSYTTKL
jgi:hypothetical protein